MKTVDLHEAHKRLFHNVQGHTVSMTARNKRGIQNSEFTYGEIKTSTFDEILKTVSPKEGEIFYDLGSGAGKAVLWAAMAFPFKKSVGIELFDELNTLSKTVLSTYTKEILPLLPKEKQRQEIEFVQGNLTNYDLSEADVVFAHLTCSSDETMTALLQNLSKLKAGSRVITVTKTITSPHFKLLETKDYVMGWGEGTNYFYEKT